MNIPEIDYTDYARLLINTGTALSSGSNLQINFESGGSLLARRCAEIAYEAGANIVNLQVTDPHITKARILKQAGNRDALKAHPGWRPVWEDTIYKEQWTILTIKSFEDAGIMADVDPSALSAFNQSQLLSMKRFRNWTISHAYPWTVCAAPGDRWAERVLGSGKNAMDLWEVLKPILLLDQPDPQQAWNEKILLLKNRRKLLMDLELDSIHFEDKESDLLIGLIPGSKWSGGTLNDSEVIQMPNIPTEEVYTTPDFRRCDGTIKTSRPVEILGNRVEGIHLKITNGVVRDFKADKGMDVLGKFLETDLGARRIGEFALVDSDSPIAASGLVFDSILFDENAACHIALGAGYTSNVPNGDNLLDAQSKEKAGCNDSLVHVDLMIGSPDTSVTGIDKNGREIAIMRCGCIVL